MHQFALRCHELAPMMESIVIIAGNLSSENPSQSAILTLLERTYGDLPVSERRCRKQLQPKLFPCPTLGRLPAETLGGTHEPQNVRYGSPLLSRPTYSAASRVW